MVSTHFTKYVASKGSFQIFGLAISLKNKSQPIPFMKFGNIPTANLYPVTTLHWFAKNKHLYFLSHMDILNLHPILGCNRNKWRFFRRVHLGCFHQPEPSWGPEVGSNGYHATDPSHPTKSYPLESHPPAPRLSVAASITSKNKESSRRIGLLAGYSYGAWGEPSHVQKDT